MATVIDIETGRIGYTHVVRTVVDWGEARAPRGLQTLDLGHTIIRVDSPYDALPLGVGRSLNPAIGAGEAVQLIAGRPDHGLMPRISANFKRYAEPSGQFHGAYGSRVMGQVGAVVKKIKKDRDTRQAVVTLWDPVLDNVPDRLDYPCTIALNFALVDDKLELRTLMRSNDVWLGLPYDIFQFTQLQLTVARALDVVAGRYTHETWSLHIYGEHVGLVTQLTPPTGDGHLLPNGFGHDGDTWEHIRWRAREILYGGALVRDRTESENWYVRELQPYARTPVVG